MEDLQHTLASLEDRLSDLDIPPVRTRVTDENRTAGRHEGLDAIAEQLRRLGNPYSMPAPHDRITHAMPSPEARPDTRNVSETDRQRRIDDRIAEFNRSAAPDKSARQLERIEARLSEMTRQFDASIARQDPDALFRRLGELSQRIDALHEAQGMPDDLIDQLARQIGLLATQVGKVVDNLSRSDFHLVEARLDAIGQKLEAAEERVREADTLVLDRIDDRFAELTARLDAQYASQYADGGAIQTLEGRLNDISQQISLCFLQTPRYEEPTAANSEAIRRLEEQISGIALHLAQPAHDLAEIKPRLDSIEHSIAGHRENLLDAVREAADSAVARALEHGSQRETAIARQLADDMKSLEALARNADERNSKTFSTVHDTLVNVVDRLGRLEQEMGTKKAARPVAASFEAPARKSHAEKVPPVVNPFAIAPQAQAVTATGKQNSTDRPSPDKRQEPQLDRKPEAVQPDRDGVLDLNAIMRRVREERRQQDDKPEAPHETGGKADYITVARRAVQVAVDDVEKLHKETLGDETKKKKSIVDIFQRQRKPILLAIGAIMIAIAGLQIGSAFLDRTEQAEMVADAIPQKTADIDTATTASIQSPAPQAQTEELAKAAPEESAAPVKEPEPVEASEEQAPTTVETEVAMPAPVTTETAPEPDAVQAELPVIPEEAGPAALREAAAQGDARALFEIGNRYMEGRGVAADFAKAAKWYEYAAGQGFAPAQYRIGNFNEKGLGMPRDLAKAKDWYQRAALKGNASAMHNLAVLLASGANGAPDNASAVRWFTDAAELGVKDSQFNLGILAAKGVGMPVNLEESYKWFALAANSGDKDAAEKRDQIAAALKPEQIARAKGAVQLWKARPLDDAANSVDVPEGWGGGKPVTTGSVDMKKAVRNIQFILQKNGYDVGTADGMMGAKTRSAIASFQKANGLDPTGEVDQKLVHLLLEKNK